MKARRVDPVSYTHLIGAGPFSQRIQERFGVKEFSQFAGAQMIAEKYGFDRDALDRFALKSHQLAAAATQAGAFDAEILPLSITNAAGVSELHKRDEGIRFDATLEGIGLSLIHIFFCRYARGGGTGG